ncbi:MAG: DegT/DnrJ/EryC1/StrS family aminotransferase [Thermodesulfobacteriota bacterium]
MIPLVDLRKQFLTIESDLRHELEHLFTTCHFILGEEVERFEDAFAHYLGARFVIGMGSGTEALHLALCEADIGDGDEVLVPANSFIATALAVTHTGATPVFVDIDEESYNIDCGQIEEKITRRTKAIMPVHLYGQAADMDGVMAIAARHHLHIIEDACQVHGARYMGKRVGTMGRSGCFSFYPGKNLGAYGDGGAIATNSEEVAAKLKALRNYGQQEKYRHDIIGFNSRLDAMQAVVLRVKLQRLDEWNRQRQDAADLYAQLLAGRVRTPAVLDHRDHVFHIYPIRVRERDRMLSALHHAGIGAAIHYPIPLHLQKCYLGLGHRKGDFPVTEGVSEELLSLPLYPEIEEDEIRHVSKTLLGSLDAQQL